jgi:hypothetical protein
MQENLKAIQTLEKLRLGSTRRLEIVTNHEYEQCAIRNRFSNVWLEMINNLVHHLSNTLKNNILYYDRYAQILLMLYEKISFVMRQTNRVYHDLTQATYFFC